MKASELIERLRSLIVEHGDCTVTDDCHAPIESVTWEVHPSTLECVFMIRFEASAEASKIKHK